MKKGRKISGGKYKKSRKKKKYELGRQPRIVKIGETKRKRAKTRGGDEKTVLLRSNIMNVIDPKTKKFDEMKYLLGLNSIQQAKNLYMKQYDRPGFFGGIREFTLDDFRNLVFKNIINNISGKL